MWSQTNEPQANRSRMEWTQLSAHRICDFKIFDMKAIGLPCEMQMAINRESNMIWGSSCPNSDCPRCLQS